MIKLIGVSLLVGSSMFVTSVVGAAVYLVTGGIAVCQVETDDVDLTIPVPTRLADMGLLAARIAMPAEELAEVRREIEPYLPALEGMIEAISRVEDGTTLVSVETRGETVLVARRNGRFHVDVEADDATVHVSMPARSLRRLGGEMSLLF
jgi:hypothetical protein